MDRRKLNGIILGSLVGLALLGTGVVATVNVINLRSGSAEAAVGFLGGQQAILKTVSQGSAAAVATPGVPVVADPGVRTQNFLSSLGDALSAAFESSGKLLVKNTLSRFLGELARSTAEWIATGSPGQRPLFETQAGYEFMTATRDAATAEFLDKLGSAYGIDVCNPELGAKLVIHYSSLPSTRLQTPRCSLKTIQDKWAQLLPNQAAFLREFSLALEPDQNDLGIALDIEGKLLVERETKANAALLERLESQGLKPLKDLAGNIITPAAAVSEQIRQTLSLSGQKELAFIGDPVADAIGIFTNTLGSRLQEKWLKKGFVNIADVFNRTGSSQLFGGVGRYSVAEPRFAALAELELGTSGAVDVLGELSTCTDPDEPGYGSQCVLDPSFSQAIQQQLTVREAMDRGLLRGEWVFGYQQDGSEPRYGTGYPYSSMVILRAKRALPVGWEMAAQVARALNVSVTLEHVVHCYEDPAAAEDAARPADCLVGDVNPFYRLVDPNWLLKVPATYCVRRGASAELLTEQYICNQDTNGDGVVDCVNVDSNVTGSATLVDRDPASKDEYYRLLQRAEYCADEQSCVAENPDGSCRAYGYCFEEKPTFSLGDASCPAQFASCIGVTTPSGQRTAYIQDTLQTCPSGAAGCQWYGTRRSGGSWSEATGDRVYLNGEAATCNANDAGCRKLLRFGQGVNLVPNGSFEQYDRHDPSAPAAPDNFFITEGSARGQAFTGAGQVYEGAASFRLTTGGAMSVVAETGSEVAGRTFTASVASKGCAAGTLSVLDGDGGTVGAPAGINLAEGNESWHVATVTGTTQAPGTALTVQLSGLAGDGNCYLDSLTLAEGSQPATLAYGSGPAVHMSSRAVQCTQDDVGCRAFTPVSGDPTVFGRITANDYCPSQCVGYANFTPLINTFEEREGAIAPANVNFIPSTARSCSAIDVGCSEFTSLADVPEGGERVAYFSQVQQCVARDHPNVGTYYTWEGSDTAGYQLRVWQLLRSNLPGQVPCTNLSLDPGIQPPLCQDTAVNQATCADNDPNPDCREVFDSDANSHRVLWSRVVQATDDCRQYRRTGTDFVYNVSPSLARRCPAAANGCRQYRGATGGNTRIALLADFESSSAAGWGGTRIALSTEALQVGGHSLLAQGSGGVVTLRRTQPVEVRAGHQYLLSVWVKGSDRDVPLGGVTFRSGLGKLLGRLGASPAAAQPVSMVFDAGATAVGNDWQLVQLGPVTPPADATSATFDVVVPLAAGLRSAYFDNVLLKEVTSDTFVVEGSWNTPQACDNPPGLPNGTDINPRTEPGAMVGCSRYRVGGQQVTLRSFTRLCAERNVGCQAFIDTANSSSPFAQQFGSLCSLGSAATAPTTCSSGGYQRCVVATGDASCRYTATASAGAEFLVTPSDPEDRVTVGADRVVYRVDDASAYCSPEVAGCTQLGLPRINKQAWSGTGVTPAGGIASWQDTFRVVNPDQFSRTLCTAGQLWCAAHRLTGGGSSVFKDPLGASEEESRVCEYRTGVQVDRPTGPQLVTGWFRTGTDQGCRGATDYTLPLNYSPSYDRFVGVCPAQYSGCTDYRNPRPSQTGGQLHNYFLRSSVDSSSCNGLVDVAGGCLLFLDPSQPPLYSTAYSYPPNRLPGQPPVSTSTLDTNVILKVRRDRSCSQWYTCGSSVAVPGSATGQRVCTSLTSCSLLDPATNQCANPGSGLFTTGSAVAGEFTFASPADSSRWKNLSGYTVPGIQLTSTDIISRGYAPLSSMPQIGLSARVTNGDFEQSDGPDSLVDGGADWHSCDSGSPAVPDTQACAYTTTAGKVAEGRAALKLATTLNAAANLSHSSIALTPGTRYSVSVQFNTLDLASGDVRLEVAGGGPLLTLTQSSGSGWQQQLGSFVATGATTLRLSASADATGSAYVDEVKIQPVLQVSPDPLPRFTGQQCRVYPRGDAPSCRYTQDDGEYRGVVGYCLQADPRNPSRCIQWWPVDVVAGQSLDVFGETISLPGRTPLRYCTEASGNADAGGNYWRQSFDFNNNHDTSGHVVYHSTTTDPSSWEWQVHWSKLAGIKWEWYAGESGDYVRELQFLGNLRQWDEDDSRGGVHGFGFYSGQQYNGSNYNSLFIGVNPDTGLLESFRGWTDDDSGSDGESAHFRTFLIHKEQCEVVAQVRSGDDHTAWFSRFNNGDDVDAGDATLRAGDDAAPYGAVSANAASDPMGAMCDDLVLASTTMAIARGCALPVGTYPVAQSGAQVERAGTPLACPSGQCAAPQCSRNRGNRCDPATSDVQQCFDIATPPDVSYCIGTPTASARDGDRNVGATRLANVFARSYSTWTVDPNTNRYADHDCSDPTIQSRLVSGSGLDSISGCWDLRRQLTSDTDLPQVSQFAINGVTSGEVAGSAGSRVELKFNSLLNPERLPLRYISIDWGTGPVEQTARLSINHQPAISSPHVFEKFYTAEDVAALPDCASGGGKCATVRVQIEDNWGYCNGAPATGYSLADTSLRQDIAGCGPASTGRWTVAPVFIRFSGGGGGGIELS